MKMYSFDAINPLTLKSDASIHGINKETYFKIFKTYIARDMRLLDYYKKHRGVTDEQVAEMYDPANESKYKITAKEVFQIKNQNLRSLIVSKIPADEFMETLSAVKVSEKVITKVKRFIKSNDHTKLSEPENETYQDTYTVVKIPMEVLGLAEEDEVVDDAYYVIVTCPSTGQKYMLGALETEALEAVASTFQVPASVDFKHILKIDRQGDVPVYTVDNCVREQFLKDMSENNYRPMTVEEWLTFDIES